MKVDPVEKYDVVVMVMQLNILIDLYFDRPIRTRGGIVLFLLYVNDLPKAVLSSKVDCFADDTKVLKGIESQKTVDLQSDIDNLNTWAAVG
jgi:hypothetical protein